MREIKLLHWYHDIMNLYGDYANVSAMKRILEKNGCAVQVDKLSFADKPDLNSYDFIFIGSGTEKNQRVVLDDLRQYADALKQYIDSGKLALLTGNSFEMLGKGITDCRGNRFDGLGFCGFEVSEQNKTRVTADVIFECDFLTKPLVGFVNKCSEIKGVSNALFRVKTGLGNCDGDKSEGVRLNQLFGTHLTGPVLVKNPHFLAYLAEKLLGKTPDLSTFAYERAGYEVTLTELTNRCHGGQFAY